MLAHHRRYTSQEVRALSKVPRILKQVLSFQVETRCFNRGAVSASLSSYQIISGLSYFMIMCDQLVG